MEARRVAMSGYFAPPSSGARAGVTIPRIWITIALSILVHALLLWQVNPRLHSGPADDAVRPDEGKGPLNIVILPPARPRPPVVAQRPRPPAPPRAAPVPRPPRETPPPRVAPRPPPPPPVIARSAPAEAPVRVAPPPPPAAVPREDFAAALEARRRARGETMSPAPPPGPAAAVAPPAPPAESANERANRLAALNLGTGNKPTYGKRPPGGGVFQIETRSYDYARYAFYGWNRDIRRDALQTIEVRKGNAPDIRVAIVRSMIDVIRRDYDEQDFTWESRSGRIVTLSARRRDQAGLEAYLISEFFPDDRRPIGAQ
ncbi:MAG TPA: hypothetical protein VHP37_10900 [Burkholderiales bacterium]|nr:hypothetical protein [Burkholderiales bacterium]